MSDLFHIAIPFEIQVASLALLATMAHQAEDEDDDITLMQVMGEVQRRDERVEPIGITQFRPKLASEEFHKHYLAAMAARGRS